MGGPEVLRLLVVLGLVVLSACGGDPVSGPPPASDPDPVPMEPPVPEEPRLTSITVSPELVELSDVGSTAQLEAAAFDQDGNPFPGVVFSWSVNDSSVLAVAPSGVATAVGHGMSQVAASAMGVTGTADVLIPIAQNVVRIDEAHLNGHVLGGTYAPMAAILRAGGYVVDRLTQSITPAALAGADIVVISNALNVFNSGGNWTLPTPSAFDSTEVAALVDWITAGGSLLLVADHMPFPGGASGILAAIGVTSSNGFAFDTLQLGEPSGCLAPDQIHRFRSSDGSLAPHPIVRGENTRQLVDSVATFTGHAFQVAAAQPLMIFSETSVSLEPTVAWEFPPSTPRISVGGWTQGAALTRGLGRIVVLGEAAMFTTQSCGGGFPMGMNSSVAGQNRQFLINVFHWLSAVLPES